MEKNLIIIYQMEHLEIRKGRLKETQILSGLTKFLMKRKKIKIEIPDDHVVQEKSFREFKD